MAVGIGEARKAEILAIVEAQGQAANVPPQKLAAMLKAAKDRMEAGALKP